MSAAYFHERDLGALGIAADVQWAGIDRLAVHLSPDSLDALVENFQDDDRVAERIDEAQAEGYEVGKEETDQEWRDLLGDLRQAWATGSVDDLLVELTGLGEELDWGSSSALDRLHEIIHPND